VVLLAPVKATLPLDPALRDGSPIGSSSADGADKDMQREALWVGVPENRNTGTRDAGQTGWLAQITRARLYQPRNLMRGTG
jgi:hypothetical protein